jgi:DedD protein
MNRHMNRGLKERLIGAAVLVAVGAWLIPWVLDGPETAREPQGAAALDLPAPAADAPPTRSQTIMLDQRRDSPVAGGDTAAESEPAAANAVEPAIDATPPPTAAPPAAAVTVPDPAPPEAATRDETKSDAAAPAPAAGGETQWFVQLGSFGDAENARRLAEGVEALGFDAEVSTFRGSGRELHRVRIGPQETRQRAEAISSSLSAHGYVAQVVFE